MNKLAYLIGIGFMLSLISCEPVRIVSAKYNGSDVIPFPCGNMKIIAVTRNNLNYDLLLNYVFTDTVIFKPDIQALRKGMIISEYSHETNPKYWNEHILFGDSVLRITGVYCSRWDVAISDTLFVHVSGFFDKGNNPIFLEPIEYYIEDVVNYNPLRDGRRDYVSSKKKIDKKNGYLIFDDGVHRAYR